MVSLYYIRVKGNTLIYAVFISTVLTMICSLIIGLNYYRNYQNKKVWAKHICRLNVENGINLMQAEPGFFKYNESIRFSLFSNKNDTVTLRKELWGVFDLLIAESSIRGDTITKAVLAGNYYKKEDLPAIWLSKATSYLKVAGNTIINGKAIVPGGRISPATINGIPFTGTLPAPAMITNTSLFMNIENEWEKIRYDNLLSNLSSNSNTSSNSAIPAKTKVDFRSQAEVFRFTSDVYLDNIAINGKAAVICDGNIIIGANTKLEDIIIIGKSITIENDFKGVVQLFAYDSIIINENCNLMYPSTVVIYHQNQYGSSAKICVKSNSQVSGVILCWSESPCIRNSFIVNLYPESVVNGQIICNDQVQAEGFIYGSLVAKEACFRTKYSTQNNVLINSVIDYEKLFEEYAGIDISEKINIEKTVKWLN